MILATIFSPNWFDHFLTFSYALFKTNNIKIKLYLLSDYIEPSELNKIDRLCKIFGNEYEYIDVSELYNKHLPSGINADNRFTKYTLYKAFLPRIIMEDRVLFLDGDTIVNGDLSEFYNTDFENKYLMAGVEDTGLRNGYKTSIGLNENSPYLNAGSLLFNLKEIRKLNIDKKWIELINNKFFECHEQCVFNLTLKDKIKVVDPKFNASVSTSLKFKNNEDVIIAHFAGIKSSGKEWVKNLPFSQIWDKWQKEYDENIKNNIPKIIHTVWLGNNEKPEVVKKCFDSWRKYCPDYQIIEWNEDNFPINSHPYVKEAYDKKMYAFCTDYIRLWALYNYGGIYCDSDYEVYKNLDCFLEQRAFTGHETKDITITAIMGSEKEHPWIKYLLSYYEKAKFETKPNTGFITEMNKKWIQKQENGFTYLKEDVVVYPIHIFCNFDHNDLKVIPNSESYGCHLFLGTWMGRTKIKEKKYNIDLSDILVNDKYNWQMTYAEKALAYYLINKLKNKNNAIEIGSFQGGFTKVLSNNFNKVYSLDINHNNIFNKQQYNNVEWMTGDSKVKLPLLVDKINNSDEIINFVLIDGDHGYDGCFNDINNIIKIKPKDDLIILIHDSWYIETRRSICATKWKDNPYVHFIDTDFASGDLMMLHGKNQFISGFCLVVMSPKKREYELIIKQSQDYMYCTVNKAFGNQI